MRRALALALLGLACLAPAAAAAPDYSRPADLPPPGLNDFACQPSAAHPNPVVLVHGLGANQYFNWFWMGPKIKAAGYCVFSLTYGRDPDFPYPFDQIGGVRKMQESSAELATFVDKVLAATGAAKVDLVGHSEGTVMPRWYLKFRGGAAKVDKFVGLTPLWRGSNVLAAADLYALGRTSGFSQAAETVLGQFCESCTSFVRGSDYLNSVNAGGEGVPGVKITAIMTRYDELVIPYTSGINSDPTARNIVLQDGCPLDLAEHVALVLDPVTLGHVLNALDPANPKPVKCQLVLPGIGAPY